MSSLTKNIIIGSRGSELALWQSNHIKGQLETSYPNVNVSIKIVKTTGDQILDSPLSLIGGKGLFTAELEQALLSKHVDIAVHSLKDLPTDCHPELTVAAIPLREDVRDVFIGRSNISSIQSLPIGATIATGSLRRKAQLLALRPDLNVIDIRGNVPTRIKKLRESKWDGMILAAAGLIRLSLQSEISEFIEPKIMLPAPGQGALAIECRADDHELRELLAPLNDIDTQLCVTGERIVLGELGGGCQLPLGALAIKDGDAYTLSACIADPEGTSLVRLTSSSAKDDFIQTAKELANKLRLQGGNEILSRLNTNAHQ